MALLLLEESRRAPCRQVAGSWLGEGDGPAAHLSWWENHSDWLSGTSLGSPSPSPLSVSTAPGLSWAMAKKDEVKPTIIVRMAVSVLEGLARGSWLWSGLDAYRARAWWLLTGLARFWTLNPSQPFSCHDSISLGQAPCQKNVRRISLLCPPQRARRWSQEACVTVWRFLMCKGKSGDSIL